MRNATRMTISTFGGLVGLMGMEHGLGEILQGNIKPNGLMILSWPDSAFFQILGGEPAMTIVPNMLVSGILATLVSLTYLAWVVWLIDYKHSGWVLTILSVLMLLFGGGIFPPIFGGLIAAVAANRRATSIWVGKLFSENVHLVLAKAWPWAFGLGILSWLAMIPGVPVLNYVFGVENTSLIFIILGCMFGFPGLAELAGIARDARGKTGMVGWISREAPQ